MKSWLLYPVLVIALVAGTFEGYAAYSRHQKTLYARGGAFDVISSNAARTGKVHEKASPRRSEANPNATKAPRITRPTTRLATHTTRSTLPVAPTHAATHLIAPSNRPTHSAPTTAPARRALAYNTPKPGVYTLAVTGEEQAKFGPISPCHNHFPADATLDVHHATGEAPNSYDFDLRLYPGSPNKHDERHIYTYNGDSVVQSFEQETVTCFGIKQSTVVDYKPSQVRVAGPLSVDAHWHNHGGGSDRTETGNSHVVKQSTMRLGGRSYRVYEIATKLALAGSESGYRDQTWWYAPELGMPLKFGETLHGARKGGSYTASYTATVTSGP